MSNFCRLAANGGAKVSMKSYFMEIIFFLSRQKCFIRSKLPTIACWSREEREEGAKTTCFMSKETLVPQANHSQHSSPVQALNLTVESKSLPVESNNSTIELHLPIEA